MFVQEYFTKKHFLTNYNFSVILQFSHCINTADRYILFRNFYNSKKL